MRNRKHIFKGWTVPLLVAVFVIPLLGWTAYPKFSHRSVPDNSQGLENEAVPSSSSQVTPAGNAERGQELFMGKLHLQNGGPPCMGCHSVGSNGMLGGGALGPNLTNVAARRSQSELAEILASPVSAAKPVYSEHPLTAEEQADLLAFLAASAGQPETNREWLVIGISLAGFLAAVGFIHLLFRRRLQGVRKPMVRKAFSKRS